MKLRLFLFAGLFLLLASTLLVGKAAAQTGCTAHPLDFPTPGGANQVHNKDAPFCIASVDSSGTQTARLRWSNNNSGTLQLFDTDEAGAPLLWCPRDSSGNCLSGMSLCLQADGNLVMYSLQNCGGSPKWASNTGRSLFLNNPHCDGTDGIFFTCNEDLERLGVREVTRTGDESAYISNDAAAGSDETPQIIWQSNP